MRPGAVLGAVTTASTMGRGASVSPAAGGAPADADARANGAGTRQAVAAGAPADPARAVMGGDAVTTAPTASRGASVPLAAGGAPADAGGRAI